MRWEERVKRFRKEILRTGITQKTISRWMKGGRPERLSPLDRLILGIPPKEPGVYTIIGPMFSGKTLRLELMKEMAEAEGLRCGAYCHYLASRSDHDGKLHGFQPIRSLFDLPPYLDLYLIDEVQFFDDISPLVRLSQTSVVVAAGLSLDFRGRSWPTVSRLVAVSDWVYITRAKCSICGRPAPLSRRLSGSSETVDVTAEYTPVCTEHGQDILKGEGQLAKILERGGRDGG